MKKSLFFQKLCFEPEEEFKIFKGTTFKKKTLYIQSQPSKQKTMANIYEIKFKENSAVFNILSALKPIFPKFFLKNIKKGAIINAGFAFNIDYDKGVKPIDSTYHFHVINHQLINLPTRTKTALISNKGKIRPVKIKARGFLYFGNSRVVWIGNHEKNQKAKNIAIVFDISNQGLIKDRNSKISIDEERRYVKKCHGYKNIVIGLKNHRGNNVLYIKKISNKKAKIFEGVFILQMPENIAKNLNTGDRISDWNIDGYSSKEIENAVTAGVIITKSLKKLYNNIRNEKIIITRDALSKKPYYSKLDPQRARSCIFKTTDQKIHFLLIDARPKILTQQGMSLRDLSDYIYKNNKIIWAVSCDSGQSSKICFKQNNKLRVYGNLHYLSFKNNIPKWIGRNGRAIASCAIATPRKSS